MNYNNYPWWCRLTQCTALSVMFWFCTACIFACKENTKLTKLGAVSFVPTVFDFSVRNDWGEIWRMYYFDRPLEDRMLDEATQKGGAAAILHRLFTASNISRNIKCQCNIVHRRLHVFALWISVLHKITKWFTYGVLF